MLTGIIPAFLTPLTPDDRVDTNGLCELVEFLIGSGVNGLYLCGSTGEGLLLTEDERRLVVETVVRQVAHRVPVIAHVGAIATSVSERLAQHARACGADAVASIPPFYYNAGQTGIATHYQRIAAATQGLPLYIYNIPEATQVQLSAALIANLFKTQTIQGLKYTSYDMLTLRDIMETCPGLNVLSGPDEMLLPFLVMGVQGGIGTTYNCMPRLFLELYAAWQCGNLKRAQELQFQIDRIILVIAQYGVIAATKAAMRFHGVECGMPRTPLVALNEEQQAHLRDDLRAVGFFDWVGRAK
ncbi:MAG: dihydrodipicolinate synthase family protein [Chloroflexi bacterium]|nr:dihydrodipicolinate synthase family protein [Chloroflexota bacterium]